MLTREHDLISVRKQCQLLDVNRSSLYYRESLQGIKRDTILANEIHEIWLSIPFYGYRRITAELERRHILVNHKKVLGRMGKMGIQALYPSRCEKYIVYILP